MKGKELKASSNGKISKKIWKNNEFLYSKLINKKSNQPKLSSELLGKKQNILKLKEIANKEK